MSSTPFPEHPSIIEAVEGTAAALVGVGIIVLALFPLAVPLLALTVAALLPVIAAALAIGLVVTVVAAPLLLARWALRRTRGASSREAIRGGVGVEAPHPTPPARRHGRQDPSPGPSVS